LVPNCTGGVITGLSSVDQRAGEIIIDATNGFCAPMTETQDGSKAVDTLAVGDVAFGACVAGDRPGPTRLKLHKDGITGYVTATAAAPGNLVPYCDNRPKG
jgi:hypothetical protein